MVDTNEILEQIALLERETAEPDNYSNGYEYGEAVGWLQALKWVAQVE